MWCLPKIQNKWPMVDLRCVLLQKSFAFGNYRLKYIVNSALLLFLCTRIFIISIITHDAAYAASVQMKKTKRFSFLFVCSVFPTPTVYEWSITCVSVEQQAFRYHKNMNRVTVCFFFRQIDSSTVWTKTAITNHNFLKCINAYVRRRQEKKSRWYA